MGGHKEAAKGRERTNLHARMMPPGRAGARFECVAFKTTLLSLSPCLPMHACSAAAWEFRRGPPSASLRRRWRWRATCEQRQVLYFVQCMGRGGREEKSFFVILKRPFDRWGRSSFALHIQQIWKANSITSVLNCQLFKEIGVAVPGSQDIEVYHGQFTIWHSARREWESRQ